MVGSPLASGLVSAAAVDAARNTYDAPSTAAPADGVTQDDLSRSFSDFSNAEQALSDSWAAPLAKPSQEAISAVTGSMAGMAAGVMGAPADQIAGFMANPSQYADVGPAMLGRLDQIGQEAQQFGFAAMHPQDAMAVSQMESAGNFSDAQSAIDATKGFITSKMGEVSPSFGSVGTVAGLGAAAAPSDGTGVAYSGPAASEPAGFSTDATAPTTSTSQDPASVDGTPALTVHAPSYDGTSFTGQLATDGSNDANTASTSDLSSIDGRVNYAMNYFTAHGWSTTAAAGIVGNLAHESGLNVNAVNKGDGSDG